MTLTPSTMQALGTSAPDFTLPDVVSGAMVSLHDIKQNNAFLVMFLSRHCPYVKHVEHEIAQLVKDYENQAISFVGISSNDAQSYPDDAPESLKQQVKEVGFTFPYLYDELQETAKAYGAACTPDLFLYDENAMLVYRGQLDASRPGNNIPVTGSDLRAAIDAVLAGEEVPQDQKPSSGCNIKWKQGNEPAYYG